MEIYELKKRTGLFKKIFYLVFKLDVRDAQNIKDILADIEGAASLWMTNRGEFRRKIIFKLPENALLKETVHQYISNNQEADYFKTLDLFVENA